MKPNKFQSQIQNQKIESDSSNRRAISVIPDFDQEEDERVPSDSCENCREKLKEKIELWRAAQITKFPILSQFCGSFLKKQSPLPQLTKKSIDQRGQEKHQNGFKKKKRDAGCIKSQKKIIVNEVKIPSKLEDEKIKEKIGEEAADQYWDRRKQRQNSEEKYPRQLQQDDEKIPSYFFEKMKRRKDYLSTISTEANQSKIINFPRDYDNLKNSLEKERKQHEQFKKEKEDQILEFEQVVKILLEKINYLQSEQNILYSDKKKQEHEDLESILKEKMKKNVENMKDLSNEDHIEKEKLEKLSEDEMNKIQNSMMLLKIYSSPSSKMSKEEAQKQDEEEQKIKVSLEFSREKKEGKLQFFIPEESVDLHNLIEEIQKSEKKQKYAEQPLQSIRLSLMSYLKGYLEEKSRSINFSSQLDSSEQKLGLEIEEELYNERKQIIHKQFQEDKGKSPKICSGFQKKDKKSSKQIEPWNFIERRSDQNSASLESERKPFYQCEYPDQNSILGNMSQDDKSN